MSQQLPHPPGECPPLDSLIQWQCSELPSEQAEEVIRHLDTCPTCVCTVEALAARDPVSQHLRRVLPPVSEDEKSVVATIVQRMRDLTATPVPSAPDTDAGAGGLDFRFLAPAEAPDELGRLGGYCIRRLLGQGGMGLVFEAEDVQLQRPVAVKVMRPQTEQKPGARERFLREGRAAARVRHPNVVTIHHVGETNRLPFLVMELLHGQSLEARCRTGPPLSFSEVVRIGREVAEGLAAAHAQGLTHRDIKPDNIWLETVGQAFLPAGHAADRNVCPTFRVKLLDFGLARAAEGEARLTHDGLVVGTPAYMAPEQARGGSVDARSDLFSLGCVLYRLASGRLPFGGKTPLETLHALANDTPPPLRRLNPEVPESFSRLVVSLLAKRPDDRPPAAQGVALALREIEQGKAPSRNPRSRRPAFLGLVAAALLTLVVGALTVLRLQTEQGEVVIRANDPEVAVLFEQGKVQLTDKKSGRKYTVAVGPQKKPSGEYEFAVTDEDAGLTFSTREFTLKRGEPVVVQVSFVPRKVVTPAEAKSPADAFKRADIPEDLLIRAGGGDKTKAPPELVAVLGATRRFLAEPAFQHYVCTRFSADGRLLATLAGKDALVFETATGKLLQRFSHDKQCGWLDFRPDGKALVVSGVGGIYLWDLVTGKHVATLTGHAQLGRGVSFTPDGKSLVSTDADGKARLWDVAKKSVMRTIDPPEGYRFTQAPQVHPRGELVALHAAGMTPVVWVVDIATGEKKAEVPGAVPVSGAGLDYQGTVRFSPDGRLLASVQGGQAVQLWDVATWKEVDRIEGGASLLDWSADGRTLFRAYLWNGSASGTVVALDNLKKEGEPVRLTLPVPGGMTWSVPSPDGTTVAVRTARGSSVELFDAATGKERYPPSGHRGHVNSLTVSPDGRLVASTGHDHRTILTDLQSGKMIRELHFSGLVYRVMDGATFSPDGKWVAAMEQETTSPGVIYVWETATGNRVLTIPGKGQSWQHKEFAFHPAGRSLIATEGGRLVKWGLHDKAITAWEEGHDKPIETVDFDADGLRVATGDQAGVVCVWDAARYKRLREFRCDGLVRVVRFSPDGKTLAAVTMAPDAALYLWDLETGAKTRRGGQPQELTALAWQPDSQAVATAARDGEVRLWPHDLDKESRKIALPAGVRRGLSFTPEGRHLLVGNEDGSIYVLRLEPAP